MRRDRRVRGATWSLHPYPTRRTAGFEVGMADGDSTGLIGIAFWCVALAAFLLWALKHFDVRL